MQAGAGVHPERLLTVHQQAQHQRLEQSLARRRGHGFQHLLPRRGAVQAVVAAHPDRAVSRRGQGVDVAAERGAAGQAQAHEAAAGVAAVDAVLRAHPQAAIGRGQHAAGAALAGLVAGEQAALFVELVDASVAAHPDMAVGRLGDGADQTAGKAARGTGVGADPAHQAQLAVEHGHATFAGAGPDLAVAQLMQAAHIHLGKNTIVGAFTAAHPQAGAGAVTLQAAAIAAHPQAAGTVAQQCHHVVARRCSRVCAGRGAGA